MMQMGHFSDSFINLQASEITKEQMLKLFYKGADIQLSLQTREPGGYYESLPIGSIYLTSDSANGFVEYHSALPFSQDTYDAFLNYSLDCKFIIVRVPHINGIKGKYGGFFDIPNCQISQKGHYKNYQWSAIDCWEPFDGSVKDIINSGEPLKVRISGKSFTAVTKCSILVEYIAGGYSIRMSPIGIPTDAGLGISNFEINSRVIRQRSWNISQKPKKFSKDWFIEKVCDISRRNCFKSSFNEWERGDFTVELLRRKLGGSKKYRYSVNCLKEHNDIK